MTEMLVVIPCGQKKLAGAHRADELYIGSYHRACLAWARSVAPDESILILSSKYGLMHLDQVVESYEQRIDKPGAVMMDHLRAQARALDLLDTSPVYAVGGRSYVEAVCCVWPAAVAVLPSSGAGMGLQMRWLKENMGNVQDR